MPPLIFAHRGSSGRYPENTMEAFQAAIRQKANGIEVDAQLSIDNEVMVIHDHLLDRTTTGTGFVGEQTFDQLRSLNAGLWFDERFCFAQIPTLREVCQLLQPTNLRLIVELKNFFLPQPGLEEKVVSLIHEFNLVKRTIISSFNFNSLLHIKELDDRLQTGLLYVGPIREPWKLCVEYKTNQLHAPAEEVTPALVKELKRRSIPLYAWTVNGPKQMRTLAAMKVDGIITNYPFRARKIFYQKQ